MGKCLTGPGFYAIIIIYKDKYSQMKANKGMQRSTKACKDVLRSTWISQLQDRYHHSSDKIMRDIISHVDAKICNMTDQEAMDLL